MRLLLFAAAAFCNCCCTRLLLLATVAPPHTHTPHPPPQAILRAIFGYFMAVPLDTVPRLDIPLHTLIGEVCFLWGECCNCSLPVVCLGTMIGILCMCQDSRRAHPNSQQNPLRTYTIPFPCPQSCSRVQTAHTCLLGLRADAAAACTTLVLPSFLAYRAAAACRRYDGGVLYACVDWGTRALHHSLRQAATNSRCD